MRTIHLANEKKRDAQIGFEQNRRKEPFRSVTAAGQPPVSCRLLKSTLQTAPEMLLRKIGNLEDALTRDDPEIDMEQLVTSYIPSRTIAFRSPVPEQAA